MCSLYLHSLFYTVFVREPGWRKYEFRRDKLFYSISLERFSYGTNLLDFLCLWPLLFRVSSFIVTPSRPPILEFISRAYSHHLPAWGLPLFPIYSSNWKFLSSMDPFSHTFLTQPGTISIWLTSILKMETPCYRKSWLSPTQSHTVITQKMKKMNLHC
jgi:hypothetical protein